MQSHSSICVPPSLVAAWTSPSVSYNNSKQQQPSQSNRGSPVGREVSKQTWPELLVSHQLGSLPPSLPPPDTAGQTLFTHFIIRHLNQSDSLLRKAGGERSTSSPGWFSLETWSFSFIFLSNTTHTSVKQTCTYELHAQKWSASSTSSVSEHWFFFF